MAVLPDQPRAFPAPSSIGSFRFGEATITPEGIVELEYALDQRLRFVERIELPVAEPLSRDRMRQVAPLLDLLHWTAGVSYFKAAAPPAVTFSARRPPPATARLLAALYSEGLGEFAFENGIELPRPRFECETAPAPTTTLHRAADGMIVPVGGGKDSVVAIEIARATGRRLTLFSVGASPPIRKTVEVAGIPWLHARRQIDPQLLAYNSNGALNGHVPVTAIVSCVACIVAVLNDDAAVVMANERSASRGNVAAFGIEVNHQFSKGIRAEQLFRAAVCEASRGLSYFSILRGASELAIARAFSRLPQYHDAFTSCNAVFRLDEARRATSWCGNCPKCRFVYLALAPFMAPTALTAVFGGRNLLDDDEQYDGFARLAAIGGNKPFECVGEEEEVVAAFRLLVSDLRWSSAIVVRRFASDVLNRIDDAIGRPEAVLEWSDEHKIPREIASYARAVLAA